MHAAHHTHTTFGFLERADHSRAIVVLHWVLMNAVHHPVYDVLQHSFTIPQLLDNMTGYVPEHMHQQLHGLLLPRA